jgi:hypothetical protein
VSKQGKVKNKVNRIPTIVAALGVAVLACGSSSPSSIADAGSERRVGIPLTDASMEPESGLVTRHDGGDSGSAPDGGDAGARRDAGPAVDVITFQDFDGTLPLSGWFIGAQSGGTAAISTDLSQNYLSSSGSLLGAYPAPSGGVYVWGAFDLSALALEEVYVDFWASMPKALHGLKFLKIFGGNAGGDTSNYANTTFALDYTGVDFGCMYQVSFGDGSSLANDTANVIDFDGTNPGAIGRSYGSAVVRTPQMKNWDSSSWGTSWHHFRLHAKFNSGTSPSDETPDGAYDVEIDGKVYVHATGLFNRNPSNAPIDRVEIFGWSQNGSEPFEILYDNLTLSTGGFVE